MADRVRSLEDLFALLLTNPHLAERLKKDPQQVAEMFGLTLSKADAEHIRSRLDVEAVLKMATEVDSFSAKALQGVGIRRNAKS